MSFKCRNRFVTETLGSMIVGMTEGDVSLDNHASTVATTTNGGTTNSFLHVEKRSVGEMAECVALERPVETVAMVGVVHGTNSVCALASEKNLEALKCDAPWVFVPRKSDFSVKWF